MKKVLCSLMFIAIVPCLHSMDNGDLTLIAFSSIEEKLIKRDVEQHGSLDALMAINTKINKNSPLVLHKPSGNYRFCPLAAYNIQETFYKKNRDKDPLTKDIFDTIESTQKDSEDYTLGQRTVYKWLKADGKNDPFSAVRVKTQFYYLLEDKKALEDLIANKS